jgi:AcrR family transcriptional regulator
MARAAGIAEGTIFRVFPDKPALLHAAIARAMDPAPIEAAFAGIDPDGSIETQMVAAALVLAARFEGVAALLGIVRSIPHERKPRAEEAHRIAHDSMAAVAAALTKLLERHRDRLLVEPAQAAMLLRGLVFTNTHPLLAAAERMGPERLVSVLCDGIVARTAD